MAGARRAHPGRPFPAALQGSAILQEREADV